MTSLTLNPLDYTDRVSIGRIVWEQTQCNILTFACTYAILESLGDKVTWDQVFSSIFLSHKMHDVDPCQHISEFSKQYGLCVKPSVEMDVLTTLNFEIPRAFFISQLYSLADQREIPCKQVDTAARIAIIYRLDAIDRNACILACLAAASRWSSSLRKVFTRMPSFSEPLNKKLAARFFARLLNARSKLE